MLPYTSGGARLYHHQQQQQQPPPPPSNSQRNVATTHEQHKQRQEMLHQMRKHRSLDGAQFMREFDQATRHAATHYPEYYQYDNYINNQIYDPPPPLQQQQLQQQLPAFYSPQGTTALGRGYDMNDPLTVNVPSSSSATGYYQSQQQQQRGGDTTAALQREYNALNKKLNYVMNSIRTFWSPELKKERQLRQDETIRINSLQNKICQQAAELQVIQNELEKREKDISQLLSESALLDMEEELRRLRRQLHEPRNFTEKSVSMHELQTLKTKMERSEMTLSEKLRELASAEMRAKCAEEQNAELEKRVEILTRSNTAHEAQLQLLQDDLGVLRQKLESRNQQIESKEKLIKKLEQQIDSMRTQFTDSSHVIQDGEHKVAQLKHRLDQLETLLREKESEVDRLKQRQLQQPSVRMEAELKMQLENAEQEKLKLQENIDILRKSSEMDKQQQLKTFQEESRNQLMEIDYLQKELSDREILLASQNEKISQLDNQLKLTNGMSYMHKNKSDIQQELEDTQKEVEKLLRIVQSLEKEKSFLTTKINNANTEKSTNDYDYGTLERVQREIGIDRNSESSNLKRRIEELEEALRESVGITSERDKQITEQKTLVQQLSNQLTDLFKDGGRERVLAMNNVLMNKDFKNEIQKAMDEERIQYQRQIAAIRREALMAQIREKDAAIQLLQISPEQFSEQITILTRQKEQLRHKLLTNDNEASGNLGGGMATGAGTTFQNVPHIPYMGGLEAYIPPINSAIAQVKAGGPITASNNIWLNSAQHAFDRALNRVDMVSTYGQQQDDNGDDDGVWA